MFKLFVFLLLSGSAATLCHAAPGDFKTDRPSPLKLVHQRAEAVTFKFSGSLRVSGQFLVAWHEIRAGQQTLQAVFYPDEETAARLPRMNRDAPVKELRFSNPQQAVSILLDPSSARMLLTKQQLSATGNATATIRSYIVSLACDRRWYEARVVTALGKQKAVMGGREQVSYGCG